MSVPKLRVYKMVDNMPVTLSQIFVEIEKRQVRHKVLVCSDDFSKLLKTLFKGNLRTIFIGLSMVGS
jgi:hypothetical protein